MDVSGAKRPYDEWDETVQELRMNGYKVKVQPVSRNRKRTLSKRRLQKSREENRERLRMILGNDMTLEHGKGLVVLSAQLSEFLGFLKPGELRLNGPMIGELCRLIDETAKKEKQPEDVLMEAMS